MNFFLKSAVLSDMSIKQNKHCICKHYAPIHKITNIIEVTNTNRKLFQRREMTQKTKFKKKKQINAYIYNNNETL